MKVKVGAQMAHDYNSLFFQSSDNEKTGQQDRSSIKANQKDAESGGPITLQKDEDGVVYVIQNRKVIGWVNGLDVPGAENFDGGPGSGNHGHKGRPGEVGGSAPEDGSPATPKSAKAEGRAMQAITKRRANEKVSEIYRRFVEGGGSGEAEAKEIADILKELTPGSVITCPAGSQYDETTTYTKRDDGRFQMKGEVLSFTADDISYEFLADEPDRPKVTKVAMTAEELEGYMTRANKVYWRNNEQVWQGGGSLSQKATVKLNSQDLEMAGEGTRVVAKDGTVYEKIGKDWFKEGTYEKADKRKVGYPTVEGDFFTVNLGLNGVSASECQRMREMYDSMPDAMRSKYEDVFRNATFQPAMNGTAHFRQGSGIFFDSDSTAETVLHECAHAFDIGAIDKTVEIGSEGYRVHIPSASTNIDHLMSTQRRREDFESMAKVVGIKTNGEGWFSSDYDDHEGDKVETYFDFCFQHSKVEDFATVSDAISGITLNGMGETMFGGHETEYWKRGFGGGQASAQSTEYWANFCVLKAKGNSDALELLQRVSPNRYRACEETFREVFGDE